MLSSEQEKWIGTGIELISMYHLMLEKLTELERHGVFKHKIKQSGKIFIDDLEKELKKFYSIAKDEESQKIIYQEINKIEKAINESIKVEL